ncbi:MAG: hypothetical protein LBM96_13215 [Methanobrevibacter sp.]|jgi:hypothetical protein|nr:hypothetical protein [Candidatus Methanoflexus mossambicus]
MKKYDKKQSKEDLNIFNNNKIFENLQDFYNIWKTQKIIEKDLKKLKNQKYDKLFFKTLLKQYQIFQKFIKDNHEVYNLIKTNEKFIKKHIGANTEIKNIDNKKAIIFHEKQDYVLF